MSAAYRVPGEVEVAPAEERAPAIVRAIGWALDAAWPVILMVVLAIVGLGTAIAVWSEPTEADVAARLNSRQMAADAWLTHQRIAGVATCYRRQHECDVVPSEPRAPFRIVCSGESPCSLEAASRTP